MNKYQEALDFVKEVLNSREQNVMHHLSANRKLDHELQELVEHATPKKAKLSNEQKIRYVQTYVCPTCGKEFTGGKLSNYCYRCGQALDWRGE